MLSPLKNLVVFVGVCCGSGSRSVTKSKRANGDAGMVSEPSKQHHSNDMGSQDERFGSVLRPRTGRGPTTASCTVVLCPDTSVVQIALVPNKVLLIHSHLMSSLGCSKGW